MMLALNYTAALLMSRTCYVTAVLECVEWQHCGSVSLFVFVCSFIICLLCANSHNMLTLYLSDKYLKGYLCGPLY